MIKNLGAGKVFPVPPFLALEKTFPIESSLELFWQRNYYWLTVFRVVVVVLVVATVALIVHHSVAIIPMPATLALLLLFKVSNDNVRPQQRLLQALANSFGNVCGYYLVCKVHQKNHG